MNEFKIPAQFSPSKSLLGLLISATVKDRIRAESLYLVSVSSLVLITVFVGVLTWGASGGGVEPIISSWHFVVLPVVLLIVGIGIGRSYTVALTGNDVHIFSSRWLESISLSDIQRFQHLNSKEYYQQFHFHGGVTPYVNRIQPTVLLLDVGDRIIALGMETRDAIKIRDLIQMDSRLEPDVSPLLVP